LAPVFKKKRVFTPKLEFGGIPAAGRRRTRRLRGRNGVPGWNDGTGEKAMKRTLFGLMVGVAVISVIALQPGFAQGQAAASEKARPGQEGIKVHGHWIIEVRNPDGKLVTHREFENALVTSGGTLLSQVLARSASVGFWAVGLGGSPQPCGTTGQPANCFIGDTASGMGSYPSAGIFNTLSISSTSAGTMVMTGTATAGNTASINSVQTSNNPCPSTSAPATACLNGTLDYFTSATVSPAINVVAGQTIAVTVTISFS
jgi:hypothetical protein